MIVSNLRYFQGIAKKDEMCMPMNFEDNQANSNLDYLFAATNIFIEWKKSRFSQGLTDQTFLACIQTMSAVPELGRYCTCSANCTLNTFYQANLLQIPLRADLAGIAKQAVVIFSYQSNNFLRLRKRYEQ